MDNSFTNWEAQHLEHHGIPGMKWGVRRYQNEDGSLTTLGKARYGADGAGASARKMQRDFNRLDQGYANVAAEKNANTRKANKTLSRTMKYSQKKGYTDLKENRGKDRKLNRLMTKTEASLLKVGKNIKQMREIESLQTRIIAHAAQKGYTVTSKPVVRLGNTGRQRVASILGAAATGGAIGGAIIGGVRGATAMPVDGQRVKIRKNGNGTQSLVNYHNLNEAELKRRRNA